MVSNIAELAAGMIMACCGLEDVCLALYGNILPLSLSDALIVSGLLILALGATDFLYFFV